MQKSLKKTKNGYNKIYKKNYYCFLIKFENKKIVPHSTCFQVFFFLISASLSTKPNSFFRSAIGLYSKSSDLHTSLNAFSPASVLVSTMDQPKGAPAAPMEISESYAV